MRKIFLLTLLLVCLNGTSVSASWWNPFCCENPFGWSVGACRSSPWPSPINVDAGIGYRRDNFKWFKGHRDNCPDIWSRLQWKDLRIVEYGASASYVSCRNYAVKVWGSYGHIYHGKNIDSDFFESPFSSSSNADTSSSSGCFSSDRRDLISRSVNDAGKGHVYDAAVGVGYRLTSTCRRFIGTPLIGYSHHAQYLHIFDGKQVVSRLGLNPLGPFPGLDSRYKTRWFGPWVGLDFTTQVEKCAYLFGSFQWHQLHYRGEGCWNLRSDQGPFFHKAQGIGYLATLGTSWEICNNWSIGVMGAYRNFKAHSGKEKITLIDPIFGITRVREKFNGAKWYTWSITGLIAWRF